MAYSTDALVGEDACSWSVGSLDQLSAVHGMRQALPEESTGTRACIADLDTEADAADSSLNFWRSVAHVEDFVPRVPNACGSPPSRACDAGQENSIGCTEQFEQQQFLIKRIEKNPGLIKELRFMPFSIFQYAVVD